MVDIHFAPGQLAPGHFTRAKMGKFGAKMSKIRAKMGKFKTKVGKFGCELPRSELSRGEMYVKHLDWPLLLVTSGKKW